jgi:hypothetical protein
MFVIGINSWKIIKYNGDILDKSCYLYLQLELTQQSVEISPFNSYNDLITFVKYFFFILQFINKNTIYVYKIFH